MTTERVEFGPSVLVEAPMDAITERIAFEHATLVGPMYPADAIVVLTGDGATRLPTALELFRQGGAPKILISGGVDDPPYARTAAHLTGILIEKGVDPERLLCENDSQNTRESAEEVVEMAMAREWGRILLVTSSYHLPRALLTFVQVLSQWKLQDTIHVVPVPAQQYVFTVAPGLEQRRLALLEVEAAKVAEYQAKGHVASYNDGLKYLEYWEGR